MTKSEIQPEDKAPMFAKGQKIWVEATIADDKPSPNGKILIEIQSDNTFSKTSLIRAYPERIKTTKQICDEQNTRLASQNKTDITRKLEKGDDVRIVERDGRIPSLETFMVGDIYTVASEEDVYGDVYLFDEISGRHEIVPWIFLELVEIARKYKLFEKMGEYQIYDTQQGRTKASFSKEIYTFEEVQAECDRLNQKERLKQKENEK